MVTRRDGMEAVPYDIKYKQLVGLNWDRIGVDSVGILAKHAQALFL